MQIIGRNRRELGGGPGEPDDRNPTGRSRLRTVAHACDHVLHGLGRSVFIFAPFLILAVLVLGLGYVRLLHGPVSLEFLVDPIEEGINAELDGSRAKIDDVIVSLSGTGGIEFRLRNLRMLEVDGNVVASAPQAAVELSTSALWSAKFVPARVELIEPHLYLSYSHDSGLTLSFPKSLGKEPDDTGRNERLPGQDAAPSITAPAPVPAQRPSEATGPLTQVDLARVITDMSARARRRLDASSYLREIGLRNATVVVEYEGRSTEWRVPTMAIALRHAQTRSVISGRATINTGSEPWELTFETDEQEQSRTLSLKTSVRELVPRSLAPALPQLGLLQAFDMPVAGDATLELSSDGEIKAVTLKLEVGAGSLKLPALPDAPLAVDSGSFNLAYDAASERVTLARSTMRWRGSSITLSGDLQKEKGDGPHSAWSYQLVASEGVFAAEEFSVRPVKLDSWHARGRILPERGEVVLDDFNLKAGGAEIALKGDLVAGVDPVSTQLEGTLSPMSLDTAKALWPKAIAPGAREWVGERVSTARVLGGTFRLVSGGSLSAETVDAGRQRLTVAMEAADIEMQVIDDTPTVVAPRALIRVEDDNLEVTIPEAAIQLATDRLVPLKTGRLTATGILGDVPEAEISVNSEATLAQMFEVLERSPLKMTDELGIPREKLHGKVDQKLKIRLPLLAELPMSAIKVEGKARISEGRANDLLGPYKISGASIDIDITERAVDASGEMLVNGVLAKLGWQRIFDAPADMQPPLRITANLDDADRTQLGLDVNHIVQGDVPVEITVTRGIRNEPAVRLRADLANADLVLQNVSWRKPPGRAATLQCDIAKGRNHELELQNFKVAGDDVAIEGWAAIGDDNRLREFYFPDFSLNVVTRMEVQGKLSSDNVWKVKARGPSFDGREFFRSLFSLGQLAGERPGPEKPREGLDLEAEIGTVIGFHEVSVRGVKMKLSKRGDKLTALDVRGTLDGGAPLAVELRKERNEPRKLLADSTDAGQAFKLIDFYPNIQGGRVRLEVNLDGRGDAEKTGILWVDKFRILGDPVVSEVFNSADGQPSSDSKKRSNKRVVRQVFDFDRMRVPFSVGYGQFVMQQSYLRGPLVGASIRGKVDFKTRRVSLGGTYVPLQGLNAALCEIPIFGPIITGVGCEGVSGMPFAIQGAMDNPQVIVNPFGMLAPGIFREIFQMTSPNPRVQRRENRPDPKAKDNVRASSTSIDAPPSSSGNSDTIDGWSSQTVEDPRVRQR